MDPFLVGALISTAGGFISDILGWNQSQQNYDLQQQTLRYQKDLQQQLFQREDTAVQRRVADLKAAGLSPVLAAGQGAGSGGIVNVQTPQKQANYSGLARSLDALGMMMQVQNAKLQQAQAEKINADAMLTRQNVENAKIDNALKLQELKYQQGSVPYRLDILRWESYVKAEISPQLVSQEILKTSGMLKELKIKDQEILLNNLDQKLKEKNITKAQLDIVAKQMDNVFFENTNNLKITQLEKEILIKSKSLELMEIEKNHAKLDYDISKDIGLPRGQQYTSVQKYGAQIGNVLGNILKSK